RLDIGFGNRGVLNTGCAPSDIVGYNTFSVAVQRDCKILLAVTQNDALVVTRYLSNGDPDETFNKVVVRHAGHFFYVFVCIQTDGDIALAGFLSADSTASFSPDAHAASNIVMAQCDREGNIEHRSKTDVTGNASSAQFAMQPDDKIVALYSGYGASGTLL